MVMTTIFTGHMTKPTVSKHWRELVGLTDGPESHQDHSTMLQQYTSRQPPLMHGVRVPMWQTQSDGPVGTAHMSVNIVSHNPTKSSFDNIPS